VLLTFVENTLRRAISDPDAKCGEACRQAALRAVPPTDLLPICIRQVRFGGNRDRVFGIECLRGRPWPETGKINSTSWE
jgi:hypothetical protein